MQLRCTSPIVGLPQPPILETTQLPADWFFRAELIVPMSFFEDEAQTTIYNQTPDSSSDGPVTKQSKGYAAERLPACIEKDKETNKVRICSTAMRHTPNLPIGAAFQPILNTKCLRQLRDCLNDSEITIAIVLLNVTNSLQKDFTCR